MAYEISWALQLVTYEIIYKIWLVVIHKRGHTAPPTHSPVNKREVEFLPRLAKLIEGDGFLIDKRLNKKDTVRSHWIIVG